MSILKLFSYDLPEKLGNRPLLLIGKFGKNRFDYRIGTVSDGFCFLKRHVSSSLNTWYTFFLDKARNAIYALYTSYLWRAHMDSLVAGSVYDTLFKECRQWVSVPWVEQACGESIDYDALYDKAWIARDRLMER